MPQLMRLSNWSVATDTLITSGTRMEAVMKATDKTLSFVVTVRRQLLVDLLTTAVEGGINYWAAFGVATDDEAGNYASVEWREVDAPNRFGTTTPDDLLLGLQRLSESTIPAYVQHLADALTGNGDAGTADVVFQMAVFGDVIYG